MGSDTMTPFSFRFKINAPSNLQCYGQYPYKIEWKVKQDGGKFMGPMPDNVNDVAVVFLMVMRDDFDNMDVHDTGTDAYVEGQKKAGALTWDDGQSDPKCIEKFKSREEEVDDIEGGPDALLAPELDMMGKKLEHESEEAGDGYGANEFLQPVTVSNTIKNPAQLADWMKDYDRLKKHVCKAQPDHDICGGADDEDGTSAPSAQNVPTTAPTFKPPKKLGPFAWQNIVVYVACALTVFGILTAIGCFDTSLDKLIINTVQRRKEWLDRKMEAMEEEPLL